MNVIDARYLIRIKGAGGQAFLKSFERTVRYDIGQKRLFEWMRKNDFLMKSGRDYNLPTQKAMELQLFKIKERTISNPDGSVRITKTVLVTGKGQQYFINRFLQ